MWVKDLKDCREFIAGDGSYLRELLNPLKEPLDLRCSLAWARVAPGRGTRPHRLRSAEVYYILAGKGEMFIDREQRSVGQGQAVYIPPRALQRVRNTGPEDFVFLCLVDPAWRPEDEEVAPE